VKCEFPACKCPSGRCQEYERVYGFERRDGPLSPAQERKQRPVFSGVLMYFPDALLAVAHCSFTGNEQHNPGTPLRWDRSKSSDEADALVRHLLQAGEIDTDGVRHTTKVAWRALALLQKEIETAEGKA
jgi:hypothetical protein